MKFDFHPGADEEFDKAVDYYEDQQHGLGLEFAEEVYTAIARIIEYPDAWSPISEEYSALFGDMMRPCPTDKE